MADEVDEIVARVKAAMEVLDEIVGAAVLLDLKVSDGEVAVMDALNGHPLWGEQVSQVRKLHRLLTQSRHSVQSVKVFLSAYLRAVQS